MASVAAASIAAAAIPSATVTSPSATSTKPHLDLTAAAIVAVAATASRT